MRVTSPCCSSRSIVLVTLVGCTMSRSPMIRIGSSPSRLKLSRTSASYRAKVSPCGRNSASSWPSRICCTRMIAVTAAIGAESPNLVSQVSAALAIGSKGRSSGLATATPYRDRDPGPARCRVRAYRRSPSRRGRVPAGAYVDMVNYRQLHCLREIRR